MSGRHFGEPSLDHMLNGRDPGPVLYDQNFSQLEGSFDGAPPILTLSPEAVNPQVEPNSQQSPLVDSHSRLLSDSSHANQLTTSYDMLWLAVAGMSNTYREKLFYQDNKGSRVPLRAGLDTRQTSFFYPGRPWSHTDVKDNCLSLSTNLCVSKSEKGKRLVLGCRLGQNIQYQRMQRKKAEFVAENQEKEESKKRRKSATKKVSDCQFGFCIKFTDCGEPYVHKLNDTHTGHTREQAEANQPDAQAGEVDKMLELLFTEDPVMSASEALKRVRNAFPGAEILIDKVQNMKNMFWVQRNPGCNPIERCGKFLINSGDVVTCLAIDVVSGHAQSLVSSMTFLSFGNQPLKLLLETSRGDARKYLAGEYEEYSEDDLNFCRTNFVQNGAEMRGDTGDANMPALNEASTGHKYSLILRHFGYVSHRAMRTIMLFPQLMSADGTFNTSNLNFVLHTMLSCDANSHNVPWMSFMLSGETNKSCRWMMQMLWYVYGHDVLSNVQLLITDEKKEVIEAFKWAKNQHYLPESLVFKLCFFHLVTQPTFEICAKTGKYEYHKSALHAPMTGALNAICWYATDSKHAVTLCDKVINFLNNYVTNERTDSWTLVEESAVKLAIAMYLELINKLRGYTPSWCNFSSPCGSFGCRCNRNESDHNSMDKKRTDSVDKAVYKNVLRIDNQLQSRMAESNRRARKVLGGTVDRNERNRINSVFRNIQPTPKTRDQLVKSVKNACTGTYKVEQFGPPPCQLIVSRVSDESSSDDPILGYLEHVHVISRVQTELGARLVCACMHVKHKLVVCDALLYIVNLEFDIGAVHFICLEEYRTGKLILPRRAGDMRYGASVPQENLRDISTLIRQAGDDPLLQTPSPQFVASSPPSSAPAPAPSLIEECDNYEEEIGQILFLEEKSARFTELREMLTNLEHMLGGVANTVTSKLGTLAARKAAQGILDNASLKLQDVISSVNVGIGQLNQNAVSDNLDDSHFVLSSSQVSGVQAQHSHRQVKHKLGGGGVQNRRKRALEGLISRRDGTTKKPKTNKTKKKDLVHAHEIARNEAALKKLITPTDSDRGYVLSLAMQKKAKRGMSSGSRDQKMRDDRHAACKPYVKFYQMPHAHQAVGGTVFVAAKAHEKFNKRRRTHNLASFLKVTSPAGILASVDEKAWLKARKGTRSKPVMPATEFAQLAMAKSLSATKYKNQIADFVKKRNSPVSMSDSASGNKSNLMEAGRIAEPVILRKFVDTCLNLNTVVAYPLGFHLRNGSTSSSTILQVGCTPDAATFKFLIEMKLLTLREFPEDMFYDEHYYQVQFQMYCLNFKKCVLVYGKMPETHTTVYPTFNEQHFEQRLEIKTREISYNESLFVHGGVGHTVLNDVNEACKMELEKSITSPMDTST